MGKHLVKKLLVCFLLCCSFASSAFAEEEKITDFKAVIFVRKDASIIVKEQITVNALHNQIRRGIYRDLPLTGDISYKAISVTRNGKTEPFFTETIKELKANHGSRHKSYDYFYRINTGNDNFLPENGIYTYEIIYESKSPILFFKDHDTFYWNVTGDRWNFKIDNVQAKVLLPNGVKTQKTEVYIGRKGSRERGLISQNGIFSSPRPLGYSQGLTVKIDFDNGFIAIPGNTAKNKQIEALCYLIFFTFLGLTWYAYGRDPEKKAIMPRFHGISGISPAQACWIYSYGKNIIDSFSLSFLQGAISGFLQIEEVEKKPLGKFIPLNLKYFSFSQIRPAETEEEKLLEEKLTFPITLDGSKRYEIKHFLHQYKAFLRKSAEKKYFSSYLYLKVSAFLLVTGMLQLLGYLMSNTSVASTLFFPIAFLGFTLLEFFQELRSKGTIRRVHSKNIAFIVLALIFAYISLQGIFYGNPLALRLFIFSIIGMISCVVYSLLILQPTIEGIEVIEHLDGIRMFLEAMEPTQNKEVNPQQMEELLPYAVFFGLEKQWENKMTIISARPYAPSWFVGSAFRYTMFQEIRTGLNTSSNKGGSGSSGGGFGGGGGGGR